MKSKYIIAFLVILTQLFTVNTEDCQNPMLNATFNPGRYPTEGVLTEPILGENLPVCKRLNNKMQCCDKSAWKSLQTIYTTLKKQFEAARLKKASTLDEKFKSAQAKFKKSDITKKQAQYQSYKKGEEQIKYKKMCEKSYPKPKAEVKKAEYKQPTKAEVVEAQTVAGTYTNVQANTKPIAVDKVENEAKVVPAAKTNAPITRFLENKDIVKLYRLLAVEAEIVPVAETKDVETKVEPATKAKIAEAKVVPVTEAQVIETKTPVKTPLTKTPIKNTFTKIPNKTKVQPKKPYVPTKAAELSSKTKTLIASRPTTKLKPGERKFYSKGKWIIIDTSKKIKKAAPKAGSYSKEESAKGTLNQETNKDSSKFYSLLSKDKIKKFDKELKEAANKNPETKQLVEAMELRKKQEKDLGPITEAEKKKFAEQMKSTGLDKLSDKLKCNVLQDTAQKIDVTSKKDQLKEEEETKQVFVDFNRKLVTQRKLLFSKQRQCLQALFKFGSGMICATCDANYDKYLRKAEDGTYSLVLKESVCQRLTESCYDYIAQTEVAGQYLVQNIKMIKLSSQSAELQEKLDKFQGLIEKKKKAAETDVDADTTVDDAAIIAVEASITKIESDVDDLASFNIQEYLELVVQKPDNCVSKTDCPYICQQFIGVNGVQEQAQTLSNIAATDLNDVKPIELKKAEENTNILITDTELVTDKIKVARVLAQASYSEIIFSSDETLAYEPDSAENTESFDTVVVENPLPISDQVALSAQAIKSFLQYLILVVFHLVYYIS